MIFGANTQMRARLVGIVIFGAVILPLVVLGSAQSVLSQAQAEEERDKRRGEVSTAVAEGEAENVTRLNNWTIGLIGGLIEDAAIRFATDIQTVLDDGDNMRVLAVVSRGTEQNVLDLLYLKGVDVAITHADIFEEFKKEGKIKSIDNRINYISQLHISGVHILARPEVKGLKDLEGKKVGFQGKGTGVSATSTIVFDRLGINVEPVYVTNSQAFEQMKTGEVDAIVYLLSSSDQSLASVDAELGFHLLSIPFDKFTDYYVPINIEHSDYPNLVKPDEHVESIGVQAVLAVYNWPKSSDRFRKIERFIQYYFNRIDQLKRLPFQPQWKEINLAAKVPGWNRYWFAEQKLSETELR